MTGWKLTLAVESIRWDSDKRRAIAERLSQNVKQPEVIDDLSEEFIATDLVTMDDVMYEEDIEMEKKRVRKKIIIAVIAAAVLGVGGMAAAVAMQKHGGSYESSAVQESSQKPDHSSPQEESSGREIKGTVIVPLDLPLTDQQDEQGTRRIDSYAYLNGYAPTENGWYFYSHHATMPKAMYYSDNDTGELVMLCSRPNCLHDGNEFCPATTTAYQIMSDAVWLDDYLYAIAMKPYGKNYSPYAAYGSVESAGSVVLLRYAPDGSEVTEIAELLPKTEEGFILSYNMASITAHRGQIWYSFRWRSWYNGVGGDIPEYYRMGVYAPSDGTVTELLADESVDSTSLSSKGAPESLVGDGDYVYFKFDAAGRWDDGNHLRTGIWRISCRTGELQQVYSCAPRQIPRTFFVNGDKIVFSIVNENAYEEGVISQLNWTDDRAKDYLLLDMSTGETRTLIGAEGLDNTAFLTFRTDGERMYLAMDTEIWVVDFAGNVQKIALPVGDEGADKPQFAGNEKRNLLLHDGKLYVESGWHGGPFYSGISIDALLNGSTDWAPAFRFALN